MSTAPPVAEGGRDVSVAGSGLPPATHATGAAPGAPGSEGACPDETPPLREVTFVVLDLETTGGSPRTCRITEVGAVKVRGGELLGEFATLVDPGQAIPSDITALTGITDAMVRRYPPIEAVLPSLLEFLRGAVLVAHNARFDTGFLNAALRRLDYQRLDNPVVCTAALARRLVRDEVRNCRLATLAHHLRARTAPTHRALTDARATVDVLHGLLERAGSFGVAHLDDLLDFGRASNAPLFRHRARIATDLPRVPGVYAFVAADGAYLYVGKATDLRARVRSYFGQDPRRWVPEMVRQTERVLHWPMPTAIEAEVRELRLIHDHRPHFNRRSKHPERAVWLKLTAERYPRLSVVRAPRDDAASYLGPLHSRQQALRAVDAIHDAVPMRRCTDRIGRDTRFPACVLAEMDRCAAPCDGRIDPEGYAGILGDVHRLFSGDATAITDTLRARMQALAADHRFEEAAETRNRLRALLHAIRRFRRLDWVGRAGPLVAVLPRRGADHDVVAVRSGALVASASVPADRVAAVARTLHRRVAFGTSWRAPDAQEADLVGRWLESRAVRVLHCDGLLSERVAGGAAVAEG